MPAKNQILSQYARMWPREVFYRLAPRETTNKRKGATKAKKQKKTPRLLFRHIELLAKPGVYVLYRDGVPYYVGQAKKLRSRLWQHACAPDTRYYNFWNFFSAFVVENEGDRNDIESILIAAMPLLIVRSQRSKESLCQQESEGWSVRLAGTGRILQI